MRQSGCTLLTTRPRRQILFGARIAVSAEELDEEQAKVLAETREALKRATASLQAAHDENQQLRVRLACYEQDQNNNSQARDEL